MRINVEYQILSQATICKHLFEDLNVLLVLLDVAALNRVQEGKLQDPLHHRRLAEIQLLIRDKILPSILVALVRVSLHLHLRVCISTRRNQAVLSLIRQT